MTKQLRALTGKVVLITALFSLLTACGFHLRGVQEVSADKQQVTLITSNANQQLLRSLRQNMKFNGIRETADAKYQIQILNHRYKRRAATISSSSDVDEYEISVEVKMLIADREGRPLSDDIRIQRERIYTYDKNAAAASSEQEELLRNELYNAVAQTVLRRYLANNKAQ